MPRPLPIVLGVTGFVASTLATWQLNWPSVRAVTGSLNMGAEPLETLFDTLGVPFEPRSPSFSGFASYVAIPLTCKNVWREVVDLITVPTRKTRLQTRTFWSFASG